MVEHASIAQGMKSSTHADTETNKTCVERRDAESPFLSCAPIKQLYLSGVLNSSTHATIGANKAMARTRSKYSQYPSRLVASSLDREKSV